MLLHLLLLRVGLGCGGVGGTHALGCLGHGVGIDAERGVAQQAYLIPLGVDIGYVLHDGLVVLDLLDDHRLAHIAGVIERVVALGVDIEEALDVEFRSMTAVGCMASVCGSITSVRYFTAGCNSLRMDSARAAIT